VENKKKEKRLDGWISGNENKMTDVHKVPANS